MSSSNVDYAYPAYAAATRVVLYHSSMFIWHSVSRGADATASRIANFFGVELLCDIWWWSSVYLDVCNKSDCHSGPLPDTVFSTVTVCVIKASLSGCTSFFAILWYSGICECIAMVPIHILSRATDFNVERRTSWSEDWQMAVIPPSCAACGPPMW